MDFLTGGVAASCACFFSNPMDVIKTRQQLHGELMKKDPLMINPYKSLTYSVKSIIKSEGLLGLQKGISSAVGFQFVMNSARLGSYQTFDNYGLTRDAENNISTIRCMLLGAISGIIGSTFGCPLYMIKTQIQAQSYGKYAVGYQHHHTSTIQALITIYQRQGVRGRVNLKSQLSQLF